MARFFVPAVVIMAEHHRSCPADGYLYNTLDKSRSDDMYKPRYVLTVRRMGGRTLHPTVLLLLVVGGVNESIPPLSSHPATNSLPFPCDSCSGTDVLDLSLCGQDGPSSRFVASHLSHQIQTGRPVAVAFIHQSPWLRFPRRISSSVFPSSGNCSNSAHADHRIVILDVVEVRIRWEDLKNSHRAHLWLSV